MTLSMALGRTADSEIKIADDQFSKQLTRLRHTKDFLLEQGVPRAIDDKGGSNSPFSLGRLNLIRYDPQGKPASLDDWELLEEKQDGLQHYFNAELQRRFRLQSTQRFIIRLSFCLLVLFWFSLYFANFPFITGHNWLFISYLIGTCCLGGLGSMGSLAVNSLAIQQDATFDISVRSLVVMRTVLGALLGCVLSLPLCPGCYDIFTNLPLQVTRDPSPHHAYYLLAPFVLGFSTTLVMTVLNRAIKGIETIFGVEVRQGG